MKPEARLDSAVFQLTPTRTRCDLVIIANGKTEKLASGLLNPFVVHLKTAQDQIAKGGYSITLEPDPKTDAPWFTKGTVDRFVRFVSTPEVLERVSTIESEILQIDEAITIQGNDNIGVSTVGDHKTRTTGSTEGAKSAIVADAEKAIIVYKPGSHPPDTNGTATQEENSKVQLLRVLETRKSVLQKEQGMAFARAVAAGFDIDNMAYLIIFAETFGASRLKEACLQFMELWRGKHETGQWVEIEAAEAMTSRHEFSSFNASGIILSGDSMKQTDFSDAWPADMNADQKDRRLPSDPQVLQGPHENFQGQFRHPPFPQWPMHSGPQVYPPYPMHGMPYYQNYPGSGPYFQSPYPPTEDSRYNIPQRTRLKRHSMDSKDSIVDSEASDMGALSTRSPDGVDQNMSEFEKEDSNGRESHKKGSRSGKNKSGVVVIRNINYITSNRHDKSGSDLSSPSESDTEEETEVSDVPHRKHKKSSRSSKKKGGQTKSFETSDTYDKDEAVRGQEADSGNWQVFQSFLLRGKEENTSAADKDLFADEKEPAIRRRQNKNGVDPILSLERDSGGVQERILAFNSLNGNARQIKQTTEYNEFLASAEGRGSRDGQLDERFKEIEGAGRSYRRATNDNFIIYGRENHLGSKSSPDPLAENEYELPGRLDKSSVHNVTDDSFVVSLRSGSHDELQTESRTAIVVDSELPSALQRSKDSSSRVRNQLIYEPDDLSMIPERELERQSDGYDPAIDYDLQIPVIDAAQLETRNQEAVSQEGLKKSDVEKKLKAQGGTGKKRMDVLTRNGKSSKLNPLTEAQKRAEKLRAYKADLQKVKKEKEEEEKKRLEALKRERQKRIAARSSSNATQSSVTSKQTVARLPTKPSPNSYKGSKFSDTEAGSSSPLHKLPIRTSSIGSNDSHQAAKISRLNTNIHLPENGLSRSVSSLPTLKKESNVLTPEAKAASIRRLSEPKGSNIHHASSLKSGSAQVSKKNMPDEPQMKVSAILHLDKTKSATLPELKIRPSRDASDAGKKRSATKETMQKGSASVTALISESMQMKKIHDAALSIDNNEENPIIEKTVVILENETIPSLGFQASQENIGAEDRSYMDNRIEKAKFVSEYGAIRAPPSPINSSELENPNEIKVDHQLNSFELVNDYTKDGSEKFSSAGVVEKPYEAPYARATSLEDPTTSNWEYTEAPQVNSEMGANGSEGNKTSASNVVDLSNKDQVIEKSWSKESSKGFRKLLKFGRKGHSSASGDHGIDSEGSTVDDHSLASSSNDVHILKNLISQDTQVGGTPPKASRTFSILSPFRSKTSDKKLAA